MPRKLETQAPFSQSFKRLRLPNDHIPDHKYLTNDGCSIFFAPRGSRIVNLDKSGLVSLEPVQVYKICDRVVRLYEFTRVKAGISDIIPFETIMEDAYALTAQFEPEFIGDSVTHQILPKIQELGKIFNKTVYSPCQRFVNEYSGKIFGFKIFSQKTDDVSRHTYYKNNICLAGYILVVCKK